MAKTNGASAPMTTNIPTILVTLAAALALALALSTAFVARNAEALTAAQTKLSELAVKPAGTMTGYSRDKFPHWSDAQENGWVLPAGTPDPASCDARDAALIRDGRGAEKTGRYCTVISGTWVDPYGGVTYTNPSDIDIDHVVPLANAWRSGASWTTAKRESFANRPLDVLAVEDDLNASKGDKGPEAWKPPRTSYHCTYATKWVNIKHYWKLSVTSAEKGALSEMLSTCP